MTKVSVLIPCYNGELFIDRCLDSLKEQNYSDMEIIIVDDGSLDNSKKIIYKWIEIFKQCNIVLKYVYQKNSGSGCAIHTGLKYVTGEYLTLLDIDDVFLPESIFLRAKYLDENPSYILVRTDGYIVKEYNLNDLTARFCNFDYEKKENNLFDLLIEGKTYNWAGSYMVRTTPLLDYYKHNKFFESRYGQNLQILLPLAYKNKTGFIDKPLMKYIRQENSASQEKNMVLRYNKEINNLSGYTEIRLYLANEIDKEKIEKVKNYYNCNRLRIAIQFKKKEEAKRFFRILRKTNNLTVDDKINYYKLMDNLFYKVRLLFLKVVLKLKKMIA